MCGPQMRSLRLAIAERPLQNLRESGASRVPLVLVLMCASSFLCSTRARALRPRRHPLAGVPIQPHILLPLPQAQLSTETASRTRACKMG